MKQLNLIQMEQVSPNNRHIINDEDGENNPQEKAELNFETGYPEGKNDFVAPAFSIRGGMLSLQSLIHSSRSSELLIVLQKITNQV
ncbi:hypothetical protein L1987_87255 [Smallanthus sonchifolius]|nr:hypothetical protein L1987_87255 [Smallanthus sonchifolius]